MDPTQLVKCDRLTAAMRDLAQYVATVAQDADGDAVWIAWTLPAIEGAEHPVLAAEFDPHTPTHVILTVDFRSVHEAIELPLDRLGVRVGEPAAVEAALTELAELIT